MKNLKTLRFHFGKTKGKTKQNETNHMDIRGQRSKIIDNLPSAHISGTKNMLHFVWNQKLTKFCGNTMTSQWNMKVTNN